MSETPWHLARIMVLALAPVIGCADDGATSAPPERDRNEVAAAAPSPSSSSSSSAPAATADEGGVPSGADAGPAATGDAAAAAVPACASEVPRYRAFHDKTYTDNRTSLDAEAARGLGATYYAFQYILLGTLDMYEATKDRMYLERALTWAETMVSKATIIDSQGRRNWAGIWQSPYSPTKIAFQLEDIQGSTEIARMARIIHTSPALADLAPRALALRTFLREHIADKHLDARNGQSWFVNDASNLAVKMSGKTAILFRILLDLKLMGETKYDTLVQLIATSMHDRLTPLSGALCFDLGLPYRDGGVTYPTWDISHFNRVPIAMTDAYLAGVVITKSDLEGVARLLTDVLYTPPATSPRFTNFIDGTNGTYRGGGPYTNGFIAAGWLALGRFDPDVTAVGDAVLTALASGVQNESLNRMNTRYGHIALSGAMAKNCSP